MKCPSCKKTNWKVTDSRPEFDGENIKVFRKRECPMCGYCTVSYEIIPLYNLPNVSNQANFTA